MVRGFVRIIGGMAKRRHLLVPSGPRIRPTADRVKESLFDIIKGEVGGSTVLDLFAGSGNLGIEALSRGAVKATFVERDQRCIRIIEENLSRLGFREMGEIVRMDSLSAISWFGRRGRKFTLIFIDPPYGQGWIFKSICALNEMDLLERGGCIVAEHSFRESVPDLLGSLRLWDRRSYGDTILSFYRKEETPSL